MIHTLEAYFSTFTSPFWYVWVFRRIFYVNWVEFSIVKSQHTDLC